VRNPFRIGKRVYLRPLEREDAGVLAPWFNDPEVTRTLLAFRPMSVGAEVEFLERLAKDETAVVLGIVLRAGDRLVGTVGLHKIDAGNRNAEFGIAVGDKRAQNKGCGTEATGLIVDYAFDTLNLNRVRLCVYANNPRGLHVYAKVGFVKEGVLRQEAYREGRYWDVIVMGLLRSEWEARRRR
jgi:RimJ/RimL family protein N-acetyltransferase